MTALSEIVHTAGVPVGWKQMSSGKGVDLANPKPEDVDFNDIAVHLSLQCRFTGALLNPSSFYSVAQHSCLVGLLVPNDLTLHGLLHDAHEAYFGDDSTPKKNLLAKLAPETADALRNLKHQWDMAIWEAAGLEPPSADEALAIKRADHMALSIERRDLLADPADDMTRRAWDWLPATYPNIFVYPKDPVIAHRTFLNALGEYLWPGGAGHA